MREILFAVIFIILMVDAEAERKMPADLDRAFKNFHIIDRNNDYKCSNEELDIWTKNLQKIHGKIVIGGNPPLFLKDFKRFDKDRNKRISEAERLAFKEYAAGILNNATQRLIQKLDKNGNGRLDGRELKQAAREAPFFPNYAWQYKGKPVAVNNRTRQKGDSEEKRAFDDLYD